MFQCEIMADDDDDDDIADDVFQIMKKHIKSPTQIVYKTSKDLKNMAEIPLDSDKLVAAKEIINDFLSITKSLGKKVARASLSRLAATKKDDWS